MKKINKLEKLIKKIVEKKQELEGLMERQMAVFI